MLRKGGNIRILTMNPEEDNLFLQQREKEENELQGQIRNSINELIKWANRLNARGHKGKIYIKGYVCMAKPQNLPIWKFSKIKRVAARTEPT